MKPFHATRTAGYFGDPLPIWIAKHRYSPESAEGRTPSQACENLRQQLRAKRPRSERVELMAGYTSRKQQEESQRLALEDAKRQHRESMARLDRIILEGKARNREVLTQLGYIGRELHPGAGF